MKTLSTVLYFSVVLNCIVLYCIVFNCIVLYCIILYCIVFYCIVLYCIVLYSIVLYSIILYCIVLYLIVLYCITLFLKQVWHHNIKSYTVYREKSQWWMQMEMKCMYRTKQRERIMLTLILALLLAWRTGGNEEEIVTYINVNDSENELSSACIL